MLFIENYTEAKEYHFKVLMCWFVLKLYPKKRRARIYNCTLRDCPSCKKKRVYYSGLNNKVRKILKRNLNTLLFGELSELIKLFRKHKYIFNTFNDDLKTFFNESTYENFFQKNCGEYFLNLLNKNTCIYCNRNYTLSLVPGHSRCEMDHWLPKTHFPMFSLNFFNLIPSCHTCNHIKGSGESKNWWLLNYNKVIHPYLKENSFKFSYSFSKSKNEFEIEFKDVNSIRLKQMIVQNKLYDIYSAHREFELRDLYNLRKKYSNNYLDIILNRTFSLSLSEEEKYRLIFGVEKSEVNFHKRPLSKFKNDIIAELLSI